MPKTENSASPAMNFGLSGKVALVTGAAQGIGEACARRFAREGVKLVLADVDDANGLKLAAELGGLYIHCDVGDKLDVDTAVDRAIQTLGRIDILVNNAGILRAAEFLEMTEADFDDVLRVNLKGAFLMGQAVARAMAANGSGAIVNMSSINGTVAIPNIAGYVVSKGGINQLTRVMALALADKGVRVNAVAPGTIATEMAEKAVLGSEQARVKVMSRTPLGRLGLPEEIADVVAWLASDASSYVTGEIVVADGGRMALNYTVPV